MGRYEDFWQITRDGLVFACRSLGLAPTHDHIEHLMQTYLTLNAFPEINADGSVAAVHHEGKIYVVSISGSAASPATGIYDVAGGTWTDVPIASPHDPLDLTGATVISAGKDVILWGGCTGNGTCLNEGYRLEFENIGKQEE